MWSGLTNRDIRSDDRTVKLKPSEIDYVEKDYFSTFQIGSFVNILPFTW